MALSFGLKKKACRYTISAIKHHQLNYGQLPTKILSLGYIITSPGRCERDASAAHEWREAETGTLFGFYDIAQYALPPCSLARTPCKARGEQSSLQCSRFVYLQVLLCAPLPQDCSKWYMWICNGRFEHRYTSISLRFPTLKRLLFNPLSDHTQSPKTFTS